LRRWVDHLLATFGPSRLLWGSDWPVVELAGGYCVWRKATQELLSELSPAERGEVLGGAAVRFYRLTDLEAVHRDAERPESR
jgi:L-fuconolactonase